MVNQLIHDKPDLIVELRQKIVAYKKLNPNLTSQDISKKVGVSNSTFNRIENLELKKPSFEHILKIFSGLGNNDELIEFLERNYPELVSSIREYLEREKEESAEVNVDILRMMTDEKDGKVLRYVKAKEFKVTREEILEEFGRQGERSLDRLIQSGHIIQNNNFLNCGNGYRISDFSTVKKIALRELEESFNAKGRDHGEALNLLSYDTISIDAEKCLPLLVSEYKKFLNKVRCITSDESNFGDTPIWMVSAIDTFTENNIKKLIRNKDYQ